MDEPLWTGGAWTGGANPSREGIAFVIYVVACLSAFMEMCFWLSERRQSKVTHQRVSVPSMFVWGLQRVSTGGELLGNKTVSLSPRRG